jgi:hypothetical protein
MRYFSLFLLVLIVLVFVSCSLVQQNNSGLKRADKLFHSGEFTKLKLLTDSVLKVGNPDKTESVKIDSLVEISHRISLDFRLTEAEIRSQLSKYYPNPDSVQVRSWEKNLKLEMRLIDGEKRYFKNAVGNLFRLDDAARQRKIEVDGLQVDSQDLFCIQHTRKIIAETKVSGDPVLPIRMKLTYSIVVEPNAVPGVKQYVAGCLSQGKEMQGKKALNC